MGALIGIRIIKLQYAQGFAACFVMAACHSNSCPTSRLECRNAEPRCVAYLAMVLVSGQASLRESVSDMSTLFGSHPANEYWLTVRWISVFRV